MSVIHVCDGCGKQTELRQREGKPYDWFEKRVQGGPVTIHACSRPCIKLAAQKFNVDALVQPW